MFERFTGQARAVVVRAQQDARSLHHNYIGTEHLLLGIIGVPESIGARALASIGLEAETIRAEIMEVAGPSEAAPSPRHIPFTPRAKSVLELSLREALRLGHNYIGTEHLLLALTQEGKGRATGVLVRVGTDPGRVREEVMRVLKTEVPEAVGGETQSVIPRLLERLRGVEARHLAERGMGTAPAAGPAGPACPACRASLAEHAAYRIIAVPEDGGPGTAQVLFVYCRSCGQSLDQLILPPDEAAAGGGT